MLIVCEGKYLRLIFLPLSQLTSRDSELDSVKDRYNAALKDVSATFGLDVLFSFFLSVWIFIWICSLVFLVSPITVAGEELFI